MEDNKSRFLEPLTAKLLEEYTHSPILDKMDGYLPPTRNDVISIIEEIEKLLFPGYFNKCVGHLDIFIDRQLAIIRPLLSEQITCACSERDEMIAGHQYGVNHTRDFILAIPKIRTLLEGDVQAAMDGDPAAQSYAEIIYCYPGIKAISIYRIAHQLFKQKIPLIPRLMTEYAHTITGIDIHPGASIGEHFFIDHGTGVVVGETTLIGDYVRIYQGVTLGALSVPKDSDPHAASVRGVKRHPSIENNVTIYAEATILGGNTIVGEGSLIGGNVWLTKSVKPYTKVFLKDPQLTFRDKD